MFRKTVDSIMGTFAKAIEDLKDVEQREIASADAFHAEASAAAARADAAILEANRARKAIAWLQGGTPS